MTEAENPRAHIGANNPPEPTPFDIASEAVDTVYTEAANWLDGATVQTETEAEAIAKLLDMARKASKVADEARVEEKRPHDEAGKAVQARYKPLLDRCDSISKVCKAALAPFLVAKEAAQRAEAKRLADEAAEKQRAAQEAIRAAAATDLAAREAAEALIAEAKQAEAIANRADKAKAHAAGGARAVSLRTSYEPRLADMTAAPAQPWRPAMVSDKMRLTAAAAYWEAYRDAWRPLAILPGRFDVPFADLPNRHAREATLFAVGQAIETVAPAIRAAAMEDAAKIAEDEVSSSVPRALDNDDYWGPVYRKRIAAAVRTAKETT